MLLRSCSYCWFLLCRYFVLALLILPPGGDAWTMMVARDERCSSAWLLRRREFQSRMPRTAATSLYLLGSDDDDDNDDGIMKHHNATNTRIRRISPSLQRHVDAMRESWPEQGDSQQGCVNCTGEPSMDPSRQIQQEDILNEEWW